MTGLSFWRKAARSATQPKDQVALLSKSAWAGPATTLVVATGLAAYSLWSFRHPSPCLPNQTHCESEFVNDDLFRALTLGVCGIVGLGSGALTCLAQFSLEGFGDASQWARINDPEHLRLGKHK
jgi:hypothetical protein